MGFAVSEEKFAVPDDDEDRFEPAAPALEVEPTPQSDDRAPANRFKVPVLAFGAGALVSIVCMLLAAAYLAGFDRSLRSKPVVVVEAVVPTVTAPAPRLSPAVPATMPAMNAVSPPLAKAPQARPPVSPPQQSPSVVVPPPESSDGALAALPSGPASRARVVIHMPDDDAGSASRLDEVASRLAGSVGRLETRHVAAGPNAREIRFFHPEDSPAAHAVADMLSRLKGAWRVRNFSTYRPSPSEGTLEVWLPSSPLPQIPGG